MTTITTDRLRLRAMIPEDIDAFVRHLNDWEIQQWLAQPPFPYERRHGEDFLAIVRANHATGYPTMFVAAAKASDLALGFVSVEIRADGEGVLGYWFGRDHWGKGFAKEAVTALVRHAKGHPMLRSIAAVTDVDNTRSQRVLAAAGLADRGLRDRDQPSRRNATVLRRYEMTIKP
ncbi:MAG TPA: GNAT family N-acetyltransferase [Alphaproteobacteria bacterium]|nr:GNAT family N-acetyltransferase [Alphaproteobacteria bacterium]